MLAVLKSDDWITRLTKLIPAEALALYGTASGMIPTSADNRLLYLRLLAAVTLVFAAALRIKASRPAGPPQKGSIAIALLSFLAWLATLPTETSPFVIPEDQRWMVGVGAFLWVTIVTAFYPGDDPP